ncbi:hypothetical protein BDR06DRAFT_1005295 [Suillus hirtellus]|nr:hypothetical protein BDR06DRAFT_1005295 [Suillus hirtellus]
MSLYSSQSSLNPLAPSTPDAPGLPSSTSQCTSVCDAEDNTDDPPFPTPVPLSIPPPHYDFDHELPDNPASYTEVMASPHACEWTFALQEEFDSLQDLGVYKLVPCLFIPAGCKLMKGHPVFKLKRD